ncbi:hypothetical protein F7R14_20925 [Pseudomonas lini]|uniref:Uncharacterized protein n=1 Tax=Pseudomonas lini TaxID=163011 RepID=A0A7V7P1U8_9PSED|nr:hypothetical protein F7R14_20925 [Pseudomonas lini]MDT9676747.1 hypothetical protein [Pseudomonas sp. JV414]
MGAGLLAKTDEHSTLMSTVMPPSRASPLPQGFVFNAKLKAPSKWRQYSHSDHSAPSGLGSRANQTFLLLSAQGYRQ